METIVVKSWQASTQVEQHFIYLKKVDESPTFYKTLKKSYAFPLLPTPAFQHLTDSDLSFAVLII